MFLPIGDQPNPPGTPYVNYFLIALNVAVYLLISLPLSTKPADPRDPRVQEYVETVATNLPPGVSVDEVMRQISAYDLVVFSYGYRPSEPSVLTLFTAMFLHGGFAHLFGNMLFLWIYGDNVEHRLGRLRYLVWYLVTGAAATLFFSLFSSSKFPLVGASGAISGVLGFYFLWFPHNQVRVWMLLFPFYMNVVAFPARLVLGFFLVIDNLLPLLVSAGTGGGGVAYGAHIGGFLTGLGAAWVMNRRQVAGSAGASEFRSVSPKPLRTPREEIAAALVGSDYEKASELYFGLSSDQTRGILAPDESIALGNWLARSGHARPALTIYQRHLRDYPNGPGAAEAHAYAGLVQLHAFNEPTAAYQHLVEALEYDPPPELESLIRNGLAQIAERQKFQVPRLRR